MKKLLCTVLALLMLLCLATGCGSSNSEMFAQMTGKATPAPTAKPSGSLSDAFKNSVPSFGPSATAYNAPDDAVIDYVMGLNNNDIDLVLSSIIPEAHDSLLDSYENAQDQGLTLAQMAWDRDHMNLAIHDVEYDGDEAYVTCTLTDDYGNWEKGTLGCSLLDGYWYVNGEGDMIDSGGPDNDSNAQNTPADAIYDYIYGINNNDVDMVLGSLIPEVRDDAREACEEALEDGETLAEMIFGVEYMYLEMYETEIDGNEAKVTLKMSDENGYWEKGWLGCSLVDGCWYVNGDGEMIDSGSLETSTNTIGALNTPADAIQALFYGISYNDHDAFLSAIAPVYRADIQEKLDELNQEGITLSESMYEEDLILSVEVLETEIDGDVAVVTCVLTDGHDEEEGQITCMLVDNIWYIDFEF